MEIFFLGLFFFFTASEYFNQSPIFGYLSSWQYLMIINNAIVNNLKPMYLCIVGSISLVKILRCGIAAFGW